MTDPSDALVSFQKELSAGRVKLQKGVLDPSIWVYLDNPTGTPRFTYVRLKGTTVVALVVLIVVDPIGGAPCFQIGYAVPPEFRNNGLAKGAVRSAIDELWNGMSRNGLKEMYVEAIVGMDNEASKRVAEATLSTTSNAITDTVSGQPALQYVSRLGI